MRGIMEKEKILEVKDLKVSFQTFQGSVQAVRGVSWHLNKKETIAIVGESGCGKSVTAKSIMGLIKGPQGEIKQGSEILYHGDNILNYNKKQWQAYKGGEVAIIFQDALASLNPTMRVGKQIMENLMAHKNMTKDEAKNEAVRMLQKVGIPEPEKRVRQYPHEFSGGMRQRIVIAIALAADPDILICDEPTTALDVTIQAQIMELINHLKEKRNLSIIFITHDLDEAIKLGDRIAIMKDGEIVQVGTPEEILTDPANHYVSRFTENVDRGRIVTASSIMITQPVVARIRKDGPETVLRKMKEKNLYVLPVVDGNRQFLGEVRLKDVLALRKAGNHDLSSIVMKEVPSVLENTTVEDMLPLLPEIRQALPVVNEANQLAGLVSTSSIIIEMTGKDKEEIDQIVQNAIEL